MFMLLLATGCVDATVLAAGEGATPAPGIHELVPNGQDQRTIVDSLVEPGWWTHGVAGSTAECTSVAAAGDLNGDNYQDLAIGFAYYESGSTDEGAVCVYYGTADGPAAEADWCYDPDISYSYLGYSLAGGGDVNNDGYDDLVVGASQYSNGSNYEGAVLVFHGGASGLGATYSTRLESGQSYAYLGRSVAVLGDINNDGYDDIGAGAPEYDNGQTDEGRFYVWLGSAAGVTSGSVVTKEIDSASADFGHAVAGLGDVNGDGYDDVGVTATGYDGGQNDEGALVVYHGSSSGISSTYAVTIDADQTSAAFGDAVAGVGDVNNDGYDDVIVGAKSYDNGQTNEGRVFLFQGSATGLPTTAAWTYEPDVASAGLGTALSAAGDVNNDGYPDFVLGQAAYDGTLGDEGAVFVFHGSASGPDSTPNSTVVGWGASGGIGKTVAGGTDLDGDGFDDVLFGSGYSAYIADGGPESTDYYQPWDHEFISTGANFGWSAASGDATGDGIPDLLVGSYSSGIVTLYAGSSTSFDTGVDSTMTSTAGYFGYAVALADVNGDGKADAVVGAWGYDSGQTDEGSVSVYHATGSGFSTSANVVIQSNETSAFLGQAVTSLGDVDHDGYEDIAVGVPQFDNGQTNEGTVFVYRGSATGLNTTPQAALEANVDSAYFGSALASAGDVNGDGYRDLIVGAGNAEFSLASEGGAWVYYGGASGISTSSAWYMAGGQTSAECGSAVSGLGDINGDGFDDVAVGCGMYDAGLADNGAVFVYFGSAAGLSTVPAWSAFGSAASAHLGMRLLGAAGDVDQDGFADGCFGATGVQHLSVAIGEEYLYFGSAAGFGGEPDLTFRFTGSGVGWGYGGLGLGDMDGDGANELALPAYVAERLNVYSFADADLDGRFPWDDCDDTTATIYQDAEELCDGLDNNCDGNIDELLPNWYADTDGDGFGDPAISTASCTAPTGYISDNTDCDDSESGTRPDGVEVCDTVDNDCDGDTDEIGAAGGLTIYVDADADGFGGGGAGLAACVVEAGYSAVNTDCDDANASENPSANEVCDGDDDNCDGEIDENSAIDTEYWYIDADNDGEGNPATAFAACNQPVGYIASGEDCNDADNSISPSAAETCDGIDEDCSGVADDGIGYEWFADTDGDGYGDPDNTVYNCTLPAGYSADDDDCDDTVATTFKGATETCNDVDDDCDANIDDGVSTSTWYRDSDSDGFGNAAVSQQKCDQPAGYVASSLDCDDTVSAITDGEYYFADLDGDGYGDPSDTAKACGETATRVSDNTDCDDTDRSAYPGADEVWYDETDQACDGGSDFDQDGDGYDAEAYGGTDCEDEESAAYPGADEVWYDDIDGNCDGESDFDRDGDGYNSATYGGLDCDDADAGKNPDAPDEPYDGEVNDCDADGENDVDGDGYTASEVGGSDCDDAASDTNPAADEEWYDGVDQNCDGNDDDKDLDGVAKADDCDDEDPSLSDNCSDGEDDTGESDTAADTGDSGDGVKDANPVPPCGCDAAGAQGGVAVALALWAATVRRRRTRSPS